MSGSNLSFKSQTAPQWFLGIPEGASIVPVWSEFTKRKFVPGAGKSGDYGRLSLTMNGVLPREKDDSEGLQPENFDGYQLLDKGQLVFKLIDLQNESTSRVGLSPATGLVSPAYIVVSASDRVLPEYAYYYFMDLYNRRVYNNIGEDGVRLSLGWEDLKALPFPLVSLDIQKRIVAFLDEETAKIDALIAKQQHLIDLLDERNSVIWYQLFTGYEPVRHLPLKRVLRKLDRPANPETGVITAYRDGVVTLRSNRREEGYTFSETESGYQGIEPGDLVFHGLDGFAGSVGVSDSEGRSTPVYHVCETIDEYDIVFLAKYLRYLGKTGYLATQAPNVRQRSVDFRNWDRFGRLPLSLPDIQTQHVIVEKIESSHEGNEQAKERIAREISLLQERRSALITAAVTGQIEV